MGALAMTTNPPSDPDQTAFNNIYAAARGGDVRSVPWAHGEPHPLLTGWLDAAPSHSGRALVVGAGLGDDAEELAARGWQVTAFDASPEAVDWARERFPGSPVDYQLRNLFTLPDDWRRAFDLVVEIHTVQALPVTRRQETIAAIAATVAPGGTLVVITMTRDIAVPLRGRPWPLTSAELGSFTRYGLVETDRLEVATPATDRPGRVRCVFARPA
jgi:SAM-dependent methyltransferase